MPASDEIRTKKLVIVDDQDRPRCEIFSEKHKGEDTTYLILRDECGADLVHLQARKYDALLVVRGLRYAWSIGAGESVAGIELKEMLRVRNRVRAVPILFLSRFKEGGPFMGINDPLTQNPIVGMGQLQHEGGQIILFTGKKKAYKLTVSKDGGLKVEKMSAEKTNMTLQRIPRSNGHNGHSPRGQG